MDQKLEILKDAGRILAREETNLTPLIAALRKKRILYMSELDKLEVLKPEVRSVELMEMIKRKTDRAFFALKEWLLRNVPSTIFEEITGENPDLIQQKRRNLRKKLEVDFENDPCACENEEGLAEESAVPSTPCENKNIKLETDNSDNAVDLSFLTAGDTLEPVGAVTQMLEDMKDDDKSDNDDMSDEDLLSNVLQIEKCSIKNSVTDPFEVENEELWNEMLQDPLSIMKPDNSKDIFKIHLGYNIFVTAGFWQNKLKMHLRKYYEETGRPSEYGVTFSPEEVTYSKALPKFLKLNELLQDVQGNRGKEYRFPFTENVFFSFVLGEGKIDVRKWFYPCSKTLTPTRSGLKLRKWHMDKFRALLSRAESLLSQK